MKLAERQEDTTKMAWWMALLPLALAVGWLSSNLTASPIFLVAVALGMVYLLFAVSALRSPLVFVVVFLLTAIVLPPFYFSRLGEIPVYISSLLLPIGLAIVAGRLPDFNFRLDPVAKSCAIFLAGLAISLPFAFWLSGSSIGFQSLLRWLMLVQGALIYFLIRAGAPPRESWLERRASPILLVAAVVTAGYGIYDFFWPVPIPHPAADQFIWLVGAVFRRAQGAFYEASNFGNFCGFFLVVASAAVLSRNERAVGARRPLIMLCIVVLGLAVLVSFSRSTWANVLVALLVFSFIAERVRLRGVVLSFLALTIPLTILWSASPDLWDYLLKARLGNLTKIFVDPNLASSNRFETWGTVLSVIRDHPQYLLFGVGYKTLPFTRLFHEEIITDNGFLNLLLETGIVGLAGFLIFSASVFKTFLNLARKSSGALSFWSTTLFSFWCGEWVQMLAADAYTYWRTMVVLLAVMAFTVNRAERGLLEQAAPHEAQP